MPDLPRVVLKPRRAQPFFYRHPWVFDGAIHKVEGDPKVGDEALLVTDKGDPVARGLFNATSNIKLRLYTWNLDQPLDDAFFAERIDHAIRLRESLCPSWSESSAGRFVFSEGDGISGLTVDRYGDWLSVQFTSAALATRKDAILAHLQQRLSAKGIVLRSEKGMNEAEGLDAIDGPAVGAEPPRPVFVEEHGLRYGVDLLEGQKTGFFLDQRRNRLAAARYATGRVLDVFCYSGGFGLTALHTGGAKQVIGVDVSETAVTLANENAKLNGLDSKTAYIAKPAFEALEEFAAAGEKFDTIILDPPKMTRSRHTVDKALKGYYSLNKLAVDLLPPGGILVTCSCSGLVSREDFEQVLATVVMRTGRAIQILEARRQSPDHPASISCPETDYLKCYICRVT
ncbi:MAG: class I SAM-dependent rRNA methyltransferase [Planctomycetaceae bacterium]|nr:class I SAM-dependent rRNA methyltransferase [Planctomycetaceae bacterium]